MTAGAPIGPAGDDATREQARLAALDSYGILDTQAEREFDDIVQIAAEICEAPTALVNLVARDRQWFKARLGLDGPVPPRSHSICVHVLHGPDLLIIPDLQADPRTRSNPLVGAPTYIRFYAGTRLATPQGEALGALCILDTQPRPQGLTPRQTHALQALGRQVMTLLELRRSALAFEARVAAGVYERSHTWRVSPHLMGVLNREAVFETSNPAWQRVLGWSESDIASVPFFDFLHPDDVPANRIAWEAALAGLPTLDLENRYRRRNGSYCWLSWLAVPEGDKVYCTARDITAEKEQAAALGESTAALLNERQTAELREQFIAVLGHDLRNPLAALSGGTRLLMKESVSERGALVLRHMQQSIVRMAGLVDNVLDFARGRLGGGLALHCTNTAALDETIQQVIRELRAAWPERDIEVALDLARPVHCDSARVAQLLSNLLGNAVTHGAPDRPIRVSARSDEHVFELSVANSGPSIPADAIEQLFQPFFRVAAKQSQQGLGLGLFIVSEIARAHRGTIQVESEPTETRFIFRMPNQEDLL
jgi:sigma-B regulation protein RsbU (phosphoserine phosphatase)